MPFVELGQRLQRIHKTEMESHRSGRNLQITLSICFYTQLFELCCSISLSAPDKLHLNEKSFKLPYIFFRIPSLTIFHLRDVSFDKYSMSRSHLEVILFGSCLTFATCHFLCLILSTEEFLIKLKVHRFCLSMLLKSPPLPYCQQIIIWLCCSEGTEPTKSSCSAASTGFQVGVSEPGISRDAALHADIKFVHVWIKENPVIKWKISKALYTVFFYLSFSSQPQPSTGGALLALWFPTKIHFAKLVNALIWPHLPKKRFSRFKAAWEIFSIQSPLPL